MFSLNRISKAVAVFALGSALVSLPLLAQAQVSLVGAVLTSNTSTGADATSGAYQYTTNSSSGLGILSLTLNGTTYGKGISIPLTTGDNVFTFTDAFAPPGAFGGLEFFLNSTGVSYNPSGGGRPADLDVARDTSGTDPFFVPVNGTQLADYSIEGGGLLPYGGASSFLVGGQTVSVTAFSDDTAAQGGFTLRVDGGSTPSTPEPGSIALLVGSGLSGSMFAFRRRRKSRRLSGR